MLIFILCNRQAETLADSTVATATDALSTADSVDSLFTGSTQTITADNETDGTTVNTTTITTTTQQQTSHNINQSTMSSANTGVISITIVT